MTSPNAAAVEGVEPEVAPCGKCGEFACQSFDDVYGERQAFTDERGRMRMGQPVLSRAYYCHCFSGDCGNEGPRHTDSNTSIRLWNEQQAVLKAGTP